jgi:hypothetical protein
VALAPGIIFKVESLAQAHQVDLGASCELLGRLEAKIDLTILMRNAHILNGHRGRSHKSVLMGHREFGVRDLYLRVIW